MEHVLTLDSLLQTTEADVLQAAPLLNWTYCWGLKRSKCPHQVECRVRQKAPASINLDLLNESNAWVSSHMLKAGPHVDKDPLTPIASTQPRPWP